MSSSLATLVCCLAFYSAFGYGLASDPDTDDSSLLSISELAEEPTRVRRFIVDKNAGSSWPPKPSPFNPNAPSYPLSHSSQPNSRSRRFIHTTSRPVRPLILPLSTPPPIHPHQQENVRSRRFVDKNSKPGRPLILPFSTPPPFHPTYNHQQEKFRFRRFIDKPGRPLVLPLSTLPPFNPTYTHQPEKFRFRRSPEDQKPWEVNPDLSRDTNGNVNGAVTVKKHGENHDVEAGWGQTIRGPNKHSETWHVGGSYRW